MEITATKTPATLPQLLRNDAIKQRFDEVLGKNSAAFISSLLTLYKDNDKFKSCDPNSIIAAAGTAALLKLPVLPQLGYAYILPYGNKATFQIGYKGLIQIAIRSGLYKTINATEVYEGQIKNIDFITGEIVRGEKISDKVIGYIAYVELVTGFSKTLYMTKEEVEKHAQKYSDSYRSDKQKTWSTWAKNFDSMAKKTVLKKLLQTYAPMSLEMQDSPLATAIKADSAVITKDNYEYVDNGGETVKRDPFDQFDPETGEILETVEGGEDDEPAA